ncbi:HAD family phosphatase [Candidatus Gottesmanbacteria bacterium]|nr:HAD family phosphatase [Candidatus Gottesmanbacteria bacterium]
MIRVLIKDVDDLLVRDSEETVHRPTWQQLFGTPVTEIPDVRVGLRPLDVIQLAKDYLGLPEDIYTLERQRREIVEGIVRSPNSNLNLNPGARELLEGAREEGMRTILLTSGHLGYIAALVNRFDLRPLVDYVVTAGLTERSKPDRAPFDFAYNMVRGDIPGLQPSQVVMVGDSPRSDIQGGRNAGFWTIGLETGHASREELYNAGAHLVVGNLLEIDPHSGGTFDGYPFNNGLHPEGVPLTQYGFLPSLQHGGLERM